MNDELLSQIENMSEEELTAIMETEFPEELEKQAAAELAEQDLINGLYAYGALTAERAFAEIESDGDLSKIASEEDIESHEEAEAEAGALIEEAIAALGLAEIEDEVEMHKTAQACASIIFDGYSDAIEKIAKKRVRGSGDIMPKMRALKDAVVKKIKATYSKSKKHVGKHSGKYGLLAGAGAGFAGAKAYDMMDKRASDMTVGELAYTINGVNEIEMGIEKLAKKGGAKGRGLWNELVRSARRTKNYVVDKAKGGYKATKKHIGKHPGKYGLLAGAGAGAAATHYYNKSRSQR